MVRTIIKLAIVSTSTSLKFVLFIYPKSTESFENPLFRINKTRIRLKNCNKKWESRLLYLNCFWEKLWKRSYWMASLNDQQRKNTTKTFVSRSKSIDNYIIMCMPTSKKSIWVRTISESDRPHDLVPYIWDGLPSNLKPTLAKFAELYSDCKCVALP